MISQGVGTVPPNSCVYGPPHSHPGIGDDHVVLTPDYGDTNAYLTYTPEVHADADRLRIKVCNTTTLARDDNSVTFRVLSIGPQPHHSPDDPERTDALVSPSAFSVAELERAAGWWVVIPPPAISRPSGLGLHVLQQHKRACGR